MSKVARLMAVVGMSLMAQTARADPDDFALGYDIMFIPSARIGENMERKDYLRQNLRPEMGWGDFGFGLQIQDARSLDASSSAEDEVGIMLTLRFSPELTDFLRFESFGRVGLTHPQSDPGQPLFATESDLSAKLILFDQDGLGPTGQAVFLSGHAGMFVNWLGKTQVLGGFGGWWRELGLYATLFWTLSGAPPDASQGWARVDDAGVSVALSWDLDLGQDDALRIELRQNIPFRNGGFDTTLAVGWRVSLLEPLPEEGGAW